MKQLKEAYKEAGPRCGAIIAPAWKARDAKRKAKANKAVPEEDGGGGGTDPNSTVGNPLRIVLRRPIHLKSSSSTKNCKIMLQSTSLIVASHSVTLENCDVYGWGRKGVSWDETLPKPYALIIDMTLMSTLNHHRSAGMRPSGSWKWARGGTVR